MDEAVFKAARRLLIIALRNFTNEERAQIFMRMHIEFCESEYHDGC